MTNQTKAEEPILSWITHEIVEQQAQFLLELAKDEGEELTEEDARRYAADDSDNMSICWDDLTEYLSELMGKMNPSGVWYAKVENFGWRGADGEKLFDADDGEKMLRSILPDTDCHFKIYKRKDPSTGDEHFAINNAHHDSPAWAEWYYVYPAERCEQCGDFIKKEDVCQGEYSDIMCRNCYTAECAR